MSQHSGYRNLISKEKDFWSLITLLWYGREFFCDLLFFIRKCWFATTERFLRNIPVSIKILRNLLQLQDGLSGRRNYTLLQNSKLSPLPVNLKTRMDQKSSPYVLLVKAVSLHFQADCPACQVFSHSHMVLSAKFHFKLPALLIE